MSLQRHALEDYLDTHNREWEAQTNGASTECPCRLCSQAKQALYAPELFLAYDKPDEDIKPWGRS
jgi:hypothetical protein